ncbi:MAG: DUF1175 family protein [Candidatus Korobacteraceae bacterium]
MRGVPRWLAVLAVVAIAAAVCAFTMHRALGPPAFLVQLSDSTLPADGFSSAELKIHSSNGRELRGLEVQVQNPHGAVVESVTFDHNSAMVSLLAGVNPGETTLRVTAPGFTSQETTLRTTLDISDIIGDGTPDFLRLHDPSDRAAFRRWFTLLAEVQYYRGNALPTEIVDCAALARFAYREALREHNAAWAHATALPIPASAVDIRQYQYPYTPLKASLFRVRGGSFAATDLDDGAFAQFADAETLWRHNTFLVGRDFGGARPGDLLFFRQDGQRMPFHAMIFLGRSQVEGGDERFVIYHTGPMGKSPGEIRRWSVAELVNYPEARWRPIASNPAFLGVYRWNILRGAD